MNDKHFIYLNKKQVKDDLDLCVDLDTLNRIVSNRIKSKLYHPATEEFYRERIEEERFETGLPYYTLSIEYGYSHEECIEKYKEALERNPKSYEHRTVKILSSLAEVLEQNPDKRLEAASYYKEMASLLDSNRYLAKNSSTDSYDLKRKAKTLEDEVELDEFREWKKTHK